MPSLNELIFDVLNTAYGGEQSDDVSVSERQVAFWINQCRADLIEQKMKAKGELPEAFVQHLDCIELELVEEKDGCKVLRSTQKIPATIARLRRNSILSVYAPDNKASFSETTYFKTRTLKYAKYTGKRKYWYLKDDYLYITNDTAMECIALAGIFEDPTEVANFCTADGALCFTWDDDYPVTEAMGKTIVDIILDRRLRITRQSQSDEVNDARETNEAG